MREAVGEVRVQADRLEEVLDLLLLLLAAGQLMNRDGLADDASDGHSRVETRVRVLEDHLHLATEATEFAALDLREVGAFEANRPAGGARELEDGLAGGGFATAGFANEAERLAALHLEANAVHGPDVGDFALENDASGDGEVDLEVLHVDQRFADGPYSLAG